MKRQASQPLRLNKRRGHRDKLLTRDLTNQPQIRTSSRFVPGGVPDNLIVSVFIEIHSLVHIRELQRDMKMSCASGYILKTVLVNGNMPHCMLGKFRVRI